MLHKGKKSDAWSFAVLIYEVLEREPPFKGIPNMDVARKVVYQNEHVPIPEKAHKAIKEVMQVTTHIFM